MGRAMSNEERRYAPALGAMLRAHRESRGDMQEHVATHVIGCTQAQLSRIESGTRQPSAFQLTNLAKYIGLPGVDQLNERVRNVQSFTQKIYDIAAHQRAMEPSTLIARGLQRELQFLPAGPWDWHPRAKKFECLGSISSYVAEIHRDSYEDFLDKRKELRQPFDAHDQKLGELAHLVEASFDRLMSPSSQALWTKHVHDDTNIEYIAGYLASNFKRVPDNYVAHELYNSNADLRWGGKGLIHNELAAARGIGRSLREISNRLYEDLASPELNIWVLALALAVAKQ